MSREQRTEGGGDGATGTPETDAHPSAPRLVPDGGDAVFDDLDEGGDLDDFDDFDDLDDEDGDLDDEGGGGGGGSGEDLEPRVKELEAQLDSISNSVETARIDTEELAESIDHIQDNIRQLLDIYEIVAKSANPFVDESEGGLQLGEAAFDLFGDLEEEFPEHEEEPPEEPTSDEDEEDEEDEAGEEDEADEGDGQTFDDLKAQYDEEDEDPEEAAEDPFEDPEEPDSDVDDPDEEAIADEDEDEDGDQAPEDPVDDDEVAIDLDDDDTDPFEDDEWDLEGLDEDASDAEADDPDTDPDLDAAGHGRGDGTEDPPTGKPYLAELPEGYSADVVVMEWLSFLVTAGNERGAIHAIQYYADLDWISADVADDLGDRVRQADFAPRQSTGTRTLGTADHTRSLAYITHLGGSPEAAVAGLGGGR